MQKQLLLGVEAIAQGAIDSGISGVYAYPGTCLLYTSDAADELDGVDLGGRRIIKKKFFSSRRRHTR